MLIRHLFTSASAVGAILLFCSSLVLAQDFRSPDPANILVMDTSEGRIVIELAPHFAPKHVAQVKRLVADGFYNDKSFYRVIEGFVAQGGYENDELNKTPALAIEADFSMQGVAYTAVQENDLFAPFTAFSQGFAMAMNADKSRGWLTHCPGVVALARGNEPDTGTSDFYIVIGQAPRYLDRIMTVFGRVIDGMDVVQRIRRGKSSENGIIKERAQRTLIERVQLMASMAKAERPTLELERTHGEAFEKKLQSRKHRQHPFFFKKPPPVLDVCQIPLSTRPAAIQD